MHHRHGSPSRVPAGLYPLAQRTLAGTIPHRLALECRLTVMSLAGASTDKSPDSLLRRIPFMTSNADAGWHSLTSRMWGSSRSRCCQRDEDARGLAGHPQHMAAGQRAA
eukprot:23525-Chlamydomonas_euryale.AAC.10